MGFFKNMVDNAKAQEEERQQKLREQEENGMYDPQIIRKIDYKGGHHEFPKPLDNMSVFASNDFLNLLYGNKKVQIDYADVTGLHLETQEQLEKRITATRILALGVFALAFKKKKKTTEQFFSIDYSENGVENTVVLGGAGASIAHSEVYKRYQGYLKRHPKVSVEFSNIVDAADPYEELKKAKELLDMGIISQEEFDAKKKQLLGL